MPVLDIEDQQAVSAVLEVIANSWCGDVKELALRTLLARGQFILLRSQALARSNAQCIGEAHGEEA
jgi:hypothetical protein